MSGLTYETKTLTSGQELDFLNRALPGAFIKCLDATGEFDMSVNGSSFIPFKAGREWDHSFGEIKQIKVKDTSAASNTIKIVISLQRFKDDLTKEDVTALENILTQLNTNTSKVSDDGSAKTETLDIISSADMTTPVPIGATPGAAEKQYLHDIFLSTDTAMSITVQEDTSTDDVLVIPMPINTLVQVTPRGKVHNSVVADKLELVASVAGQVNITVVTYVE